MTTIHKIAQSKLSLLQIANDLDDVSKACKVIGYSREHFHECHRNFQTFGDDGLIDCLRQELRTKRGSEVATKFPRFWTLRQPVLSNLVVF